MKKKQLFAVSLLGIGALLSLTSCDKDKVSSTSASESTSSSTSSSSSSSSESSSESVHTHTAGTEWKYDDTSHWHLCTVCGEKMDVANHSFEDSVTPPTDEEQGYTLHACECGFSYKDTYVDKKYAISFEGGDFAFANNLAKEAKAGDKVSFKVTVESGYEAYGITATYGEEKTAIELDGSFGAGFSFTMPKGEVTIIPEVRGAYFKVSVEDEKKVVVDVENENATDQTIDKFIAGYIVDGVKTTGTTLFARAGAKVSVLTNYVAIADDVKYFCDGEELESEIYTETTGEGEEAVTKKYDTVYFTMPNHSVTLDVTAKEREYTLKVDAPDYVETRLYKLDDKGEKVSIDSIKGGNTVYLQTDFDDDHDDGDYRISKVTAVYKTRSGYEEKETWNSTSSSIFAKSGVYSYSVSTFTSYYGDITFRVETEKAKFALDSAWAGTYGGVEILHNSYRGTSVFGTSSTATADIFGTLKLGSSSNYILDESTANGSTKLGITTSATGTTATSHAYYDNDIMVINDNFSYEVVNKGDFHVLVKGKSGTDLKVSLSDGGTAEATEGFILVTIEDKSGNKLGNVLRAGSDLYLNVEVTYDEGSTSVNAKSTFTVKKNDTVLAKYSSGKKVETTSTDTTNTDK